MTGRQERLMQIVNDLVTINHELAEFFAVLIAENPRLRGELLALLGEKSNMYKANAITLLAMMDEFETGTSYAPGAVFKAWTNGSKAINEKDSGRLLYNCELIEEAALEAYKTALTSETLTHNLVRQVILDQKHMVQGAQNSIRRYRDMLFLGHPGSYVKEMESIFVNIKVG